MTNKLQLAEYIKKGLNTPNVVESRCQYLDENEEGLVEACVLGLAYIGSLNLDMATNETIELSFVDAQLTKEEVRREEIAELLDMDVELAGRVERLHYDNTALEIAQQLKEEHMLENTVTESGEVVDSSPDKNVSRKGKLRQFLESIPGLDMILRYKTNAQIKSESPDVNLEKDYL